MKPDIIRQPLLLAIASLLVVIAAAMTTGTVISPAPETVISTPLGDLIGLFQERFPLFPHLLRQPAPADRHSLRKAGGPLWTLPRQQYADHTPLRTGRLRNPSGSGVSDGIRHSVHPAVIDPKFLRLFPQRLRDRGRIPGFVFPGTAAAALRPASPPAAVDPGRSILFPPDPARSLRIALRCHTAFPRCLLRRLGPGSQSRGHPRRLMALLRQRQRIPDFRQYSSACPRNSRDRPFIVLCAVFFGLISFRAISIKARGMLTYTILLFTVTGSLMAVPSVTPGLLAVAAVPAALLMPLTFIRIQRTVGTLLYLVLYFVCIANILQ